MIIYNVVHFGGDPTTQCTTGRATIPYMLSSSTEHSAGWEADRCLRAAFITTAVRPKGAINTCSLHPFAHHPSFTEVARWHQETPWNLNSALCVGTEHLPDTHSCTHTHIKIELQPLHAYIAVQHWEPTVAVSFVVYIPEEKSGGTISLETLQS